MEAHCSVCNHSAAARGTGETPAGSPVLFRPAPQLCARASVLPHVPSHDGIEFYDGSVGSDVQQGILVREMLDPATMIHGPLFHSPPRPENPMIHDPLFGKVIPIDGHILETFCPWEAKRCNRDSSDVRATPPVIPMENLGCRVGDHRRRRVATSA